MRKMIGMVLVACLAFVFVAGCAKPVTETGQKICPVCSKEVSVKVFTEYKGKKIYFCCDTCKAEFDKNPAKNVKIVDAELKAIAAEKAAAEKAAAEKAAAEQAAAEKK